jgi:hypothetical protein
MFEEKQSTFDVSSAYNGMDLVSNFLENRSLMLDD